MKTVVCDLCGKNRDDLIMYGARLRHFKVSTWQLDLSKSNVGDFDICDNCLKALRESMRKGGGSDE